ncbi:hypothetical protein F885_01798 [Acinetobacter higginsii]|nr:hypothetical protein F885_01798 [Acinetobacter higginsii]
MKFNYSTQTRILYVFRGNMTHIFQNVNESEITDLVANAKFKEAIWRK